MISRKSPISIKSNIVNHHNKGKSIGSVHFQKSSQLPPKLYHKPNLKFCPINTQESHPLFPQVYHKRNVKFSPINSHRVTSSPQQFTLTLDLEVYKQKKEIVANKLKNNEDKLKNNDIYADSKEASSEVIQDNKDEDSDDIRLNPLICHSPSIIPKVPSVIEDSVRIVYLLFILLGCKT